MEKTVDQKQIPPEVEAFIQTTLENTKLPANAKVILPVEKVSPAVKKERSEAQKEAFKKMRMARDESNKRRQFSRQEALDKIDEMKENQRKIEEEEAQRKAKELAEATGATVIVQKKRGRKPGEKIPYGGKDKGSAERESERVPTLWEPHPQGKDNDKMLCIDAPSPPISAIYNMPIEKQPHYKAKPPAPAPIAPAPTPPVYENPYLEMIRRKRR